MKQTETNDSNDETNDAPFPGVVSRITMEQVKTWVIAAQRFSHRTGVPYTVMFEQDFILSLVSAELKCSFAEIRLIDLPPVVGMCISAGRLLTSLEVVHRD